MVSQKFWPAVICHAMSRHIIQFLEACRQQRNSLRFGSSVFTTQK